MTAPPLPAVDLVEIGRHASALRATLGTEAGPAAAVLLHDLAAMVDEVRVLRRRLNTVRALVDGFDPYAGVARTVALQANLRTVIDPPPPDRSQP